MSSAVPIPWVCAAVLMASSVTQASERFALRYQEAPASWSCPSQSEFTELVAAHLGKNVFVSQASTQVEVWIRAEESNVVAAMRLVEPTGVVAGFREVRGPRADCLPLLDALALSLAVALEQRLATPPPGATRPSPREAGHSDPRWPIEVFAGALVGGQLTPSTSAGLLVGARIHVAPWSLGLELSWSASVLQPVLEGSVTSQLFRGASSGCVHFPPPARTEPKTKSKPPPPAAPSDFKTTLASEQRLLRQARTALQGGQPEAALEALDEHQARFARPFLEEEREVLRIQSLVRAGRREEARKTLEQFLRKFPASPSRSTLEKWTE